MACWHILFACIFISFVFCYRDFVSSEIVKIELGVEADMIIAKNKHPFMRALENTIGSVSRRKMKVVPESPISTSMSQSRRAVDVLSNLGQ